MPSENENTIRAAYEAYGRGEISAVLALVDPDLEWTYLDPGTENPEPQTCHGRSELQQALHGQAEQGLVSELDEVIAHGDMVMVSVRTRGTGPRRPHLDGDRSYLVLTLRRGRIVAMRACRDRAEACSFAGIS
jgi:ketosteroid isomerase-like protein